MHYTLITGASMGIGKAMAYECAKRGMNLILVARSEDLMSEIAKDIETKFNVKVETFKADLTKQSERYKLLEWSKTNQLQINALINNAGFGLAGKTDEIDANKQTNMLELNVVALAELSNLFIPILKQSKQSYLLNVGSVASFLPLSKFNAYAASKAFVLSFSRSLKEELKDTSISVSCLCPGVTKSEFFIKMDQAYMYKQPFVATPEEVAKAAINGMLAKKEIILPKLNNWLTFISTKLVPHRIIIKVMSLFN